MYRTPLASFGFRPAQTFPTQYICKVISIGISVGSSPWVYRVHVLTVTNVHGIIYKQLKNYVRDELRGVSFDDLRDAADIDRTIYMSTRAYNDEEFEALLDAAADASNRPTDDILLGLGEYATPELIRMYHAKIDDDWGALDVIELAPDAITEVVQLRNPDANAADLTTERVDDTTVTLQYHSSRQYCGLAKGVANGLAEHYDQSIEITESRCQHRGARACEIEFSVKS